MALFHQALTYIHKLHVSHNLIYQELPTHSPRTVKADNDCKPRSGPLQTAVPVKLLFGTLTYPSATCYDMLALGRAGARADLFGSANVGGGISKESMSSPPALLALAGGLTPPPTVFGTASVELAAP